MSPDVQVRDWCELVAHPSEPWGFLGKVGAEEGEGKAFKRHLGLQLHSKGRGLRVKLNLSSSSRRVCRRLRVKDVSGESSQILGKAASSMDTA